ncbi:serine incorporator/TMS membrane protein [Entophlyctis helioformis]|nr:serine incorporator/TMS membrane protein [Entophlyctis helioformis]
MGGILSSLVTSTACCFGQAALSCFCNMCGTRSSTASRVGYSIMFMVTAALSWLMLTDWAGKKLREISYGYLDLHCPEGQCYGVLAVYRICLGTSLFHMIMSGIMYNVKSSKDWRAPIQNGYWAWKLLAWVGLIVLAFFIPNQIIMGWGTYIDMPGGAMFIFVQAILLIDFAYTYSETLLSWWEANEDKRYLVLLLTLTAGAYIASLVMTVLMYMWFGGGGCKLNQFYVTFNMLLCIMTSVLAVAPVVQEANPKSGLAQASMVTIYSTYLIAAALSSEPIAEDGDTHCNPLNESANTQTTTVVLGSLFTFLALAYSTSRAATQPSLMSTDASLPLTSGPSQHLYAAVDSGAVPASALDDDHDGPHAGNYPVDDEQDGVLYNYSFFHFIFVIASMYLAMLITNWDTVTITQDDLAVVGKSMAAVWVKVVSSWLVLILYGWTLVAPLILTDRGWD